MTECVPTKRICRCKAQTRNCSLTADNDSTYDDIIKEWHEVCDKRLSTTITTPTLVVKPTFNLDACPNAHNICNSWTYAMTECAKTQTSATYCRCRSTMLSQEAQCYTAQQSCERTTFTAPPKVYSSCTNARLIFEVRNHEETAWNSGFLLTHSRHRSLGTLKILNQQIQR